MQLALIIPLSGEHLPGLPGGLPGLGAGQLPVFPGGSPGSPGSPTHPIAPPEPGQPTHPIVPPISREELKAVIKAKLEEILGGLNPPTRDEIRAKLEQIADAIRDRVADVLPPPCVAPAPH